MNRLPQYKIDQLEACFRASMGVRAAAREVGVDRHTAATYLRILADDALCACGKPLRHRYWCRIRFQRSAARQEFMRRWHPRTEVAMAAIGIPQPQAARQPSTPTPPPARFVSMSPAVPREKQDLRKMLAEAVANTQRMSVE
jgi:hypothetical protein